MEEQKMSLEEQIKLANIYADLIAKQMSNFPDYIPLKSRNSSREKDYKINIYYSKHIKGKKSYTNINTVSINFLIENSLFNFDQYRNFMELVENTFKDFKDLSFGLNPDLENDEIYVIVNVSNFYDKIFDKNDSTFRSLLGLNKYNL